MTGTELRQHRQNMRLTQEQLAVALRRPVATIRNWEQGRYAIEWPGAVCYLLAALERDSVRFSDDRAGFLRRLETFLSEP